MWVDESAGEDPTGETTGGEDMTIAVDGEQYSADVNFDMNDDGVDDTAIIERQDGSAQAFVDKDGDGDADAYVKLDERGEVVARASYDEASGDWVATAPGGEGETTGPRTSSDGMTADMPAGDVSLGPPTVDTDSDGVADTAVVEDDSGNTMMFTDVDGDGAADVVVVVTPGGESTTYEHTGDGTWTPVEGGSSDAAGFGFAGGAAAGDVDATAEAGSLAQGWGGHGSGDVVGVARIDPTTGQWISPN